MYKSSPRNRLVQKEKKRTQEARNKRRKAYDMIKTHSHIRGKGGVGRARAQSSLALALALVQAQPSRPPYVLRFQAKQASNQFNESTHPFPLGLRSHENAESP